MNPFLDSEFTISWSALTPDRLPEAMEDVLQSASSEIETISTATDAPTYENTLAHLERATEMVGNAWGKAAHLLSVADSKELRKVYGEWLPKVSDFFSGIPLNEKLWNRVQAFAKNGDTQVLSPVQQRHLEETVADFKEAGAALPTEKKQRLRGINARLASLTRSYGENVLDATNAWELLIDQEEYLAGLPARAREAARERAREKGLGKKGKPVWRFTLHQPSLEPFLTYLESDTLRRKMWEGASSVGQTEAHDNRPLVDEILALREEKTQLLGRKSFADLVLKRRMAKSGDEALTFIEDLFARSEKAFRDEARELESFKASQTSGTHSPLEPWEIIYWAEKQRKAEYDFDEEALRPFFPIDRVLQGLFTLAEKVFGLEIEEKASFYRSSPDEPVGEGAEVWHPDVRFYELRQADTNAHLGSFYADWHPRESKRGGAWFNSLLTGGPKTEGNGKKIRAPHLGVICGNLTPSGKDGPALLTHREVETIFHEFGHLLHHLLGEVEVKSLNGVNVAWDFVELPSQIMENWCWHRESLDLFARHFETGEPIPEDLFRKMTNARRFRAASAMVRQLQFAKLDLELHHHHGHYPAKTRDDILAQTLAPYQIPTATRQPLMLYRFSHLFSSPTGYAAGYYSYKWAEVLDADAFTRFQMEGIFNRDVGRQFVEKILSKGNSADPMDLYRDFMGRKPELLPLLKRSGLA
ncbi:MAG: M3 family metallopeptidase [Opitutales bacterium]|nr:M3 family metallopeptidase [Opitutales bacterium]